MSYFDREKHPFAEGYKRLILADSYDNYDLKEETEPKLYRYLEEPHAEQLEAVILGPCARSGLESIAQELIDNRGVLPNLKALFVGDFEWEDCQISWIELFDVSPLIEAFPRLEIFQVRGCGERARYREVALSFGPLKHARLRRLVVECGGLSHEALAEICTAQLPMLEHLELWFGDPNQGGDIMPQHLHQLLTGKLFPRLRRLGLRNSEIQNEIVLALAGSPVLQTLTHLDISLGTLTDEVAIPFLCSPEVAHLTQIDISGNYLSKAAIAQVSSVLGDRLCCGEQRDGRRYCMVGE